MARSTPAQKPRGLARITIIFLPLKQNLHRKDAEAQRKRKGIDILLPAGQSSAFPLRTLWVFASLRSSPGAGAAQGVPDQQARPAGDGAVREIERRPMVAHRFF